MSTKQRAMILLFCLILMASGFIFAAGKARVIGTVVDLNGNPIPGVKVTVTSPDIQSFNEVKTTNKMGIFKIKLSGGSALYQYELEKEGYQPLKSKQKSKDVGIRYFLYTLPQKGDSTLEVNNIDIEPVVETACFRASKIRDFDGLHNKFVYAEGLGNEHYLLIMEMACGGLRNAVGISISSASSRICSNTRSFVTYRDINNYQAACPIKRIEVVADKRTAEILVKNRTKVKPE